MSETETKGGRRAVPKQSKFVGKATRVLNVPLMKLNAGDAVALQFTGERKTMFLGKPNSEGKFTDPVTGKKYDKDAAIIFRAVNMDSGEMVDVIAPSVLVSTIEREYKNDVKDKKLLLECSQRVGKNYFDVMVSEL